MKSKIEYSNESFLSFIFDRNWIEPPLFYNNKGKVLRFDLVSKPESESYQKICNFFDDLFAEGSYMYIVFYGTKNINWKNGKNYFKLFSLKKLFNKYYVSREDDLEDEQPYVVICQAKKSDFKIKKYLTDYLRGEQNACMIFISRKKSSALHFYDNRGFDFLSEDKNFLQLMFDRYQDYIIETDRENILSSLKK